MVYCWKQSLPSATPSLVADYSLSTCEQATSAHWLRVEGMVRELYDVAVLPGVSRPMALGLKTDEIEQLISIGND